MPLLVMSIDEVMIFEVTTFMMSLFGVSLALVGGVMHGVVVMAVTNLICNMMSSFTLMRATVMFNRKML